MAGAVLNDRFPFSADFLPMSASTEPGHLVSAVPDGCDLAVVDHYGLARDYETGLRDWAGTVAVIDDLADRPHDCDLLADPSPGRLVTDYQKLVAPHCRVLTGPSYALLRPEFAQQRPHSLSRRTGAHEPCRILVSFGMTDPGNLTVAALRALDKARFIPVVDVVLGGSAPHLDDVRNAIANSGLDVRLHINPTDMAELMAAADVSIGGSGGSALERCCLGLPSISISAAENQEHYLFALEAQHAIVAIKDEGAHLTDAIVDALTSLWSDRDRLLYMSERAAAFCDGAGAERVAIEICAKCGIDHAVSPH